MSKKRNLNFACSVLFAGYYALFYMVGMMFSGYLMESGFEKSTVTTMSSISSFILLVTKPLFSTVVDKGHCRLLACCYCAAIAAGSGIFFFSPSRGMPQVLAYTVLCSVGSGAFMDLTDTWVLKLIKQSGDVDYGRTRAFGSAAYALCSLAYGAALTAFGYGIAPWCILALLAVLLAVTLTMPDPPRALQAPDAKKGVFSGRLSLLKNPMFLCYMVLGTVAGHTLGMMDNFIPVLITERGGTAFHIGLSSFVMAGIEFFLLRVFTPIADRIGTHRVFALGIAGFGIKALAVSLMPTPQMIIAACVTQTVSFCLYFPGRMRVLSEEVEQESLAGAFATAGIYSSLVNILLVNPVTGYLSESIGTAAMMRCFTLLCLAAGAAYYFITARIKAKQETAAQ